MSIFKLIKSFFRNIIMGFKSLSSKKKLTRGDLGSTSNPKKCVTLEEAKKEFNTVTETDGDKTTTYSLTTYAKSVGSQGLKGLINNTYYGDGVTEVNLPTNGTRYEYDLVNSVDGKASILTDLNVVNSSGQFYYDINMLYNDGSTGSYGSMKNRSMILSTYRMHLDESTYTNVANTGIVKDLQADKPRTVRIHSNKEDVVIRIDRLFKKDKSDSYTYQRIVSCTPIEYTWGKGLEITVTKVTKYTSSNQTTLYYSIYFPQQSYYYTSYGPNLINETSGSNRSLDMGSDFTFDRMYAICDGVSYID